MYTISHIPVPSMYEQLYMPFLCFSFLSFFIYFYSTQNTCTSNRTHIFYVFFFLFLLRQVYDYLMVSVTSMLHFRDTLHLHHQHRQQRMPLGHPLSSKGMFLAPQAHKEETGPKQRQTRRLGRFVGSASICPSTTANKSRRLVGGSLGF